MPFDFFDRAFSMPRSLYDWDALSNVEESTTLFQPVMDISETEKEIFIHSEMPGMNKEDLTVELLNNILTIKGKKNRPEGIKGTCDHLPWSQKDWLGF